MSCSLPYIYLDILCLLLYFSSLQHQSGHLLVVGGAKHKAGRCFHPGAYDPQEPLFTCTIHRAISKYVWCGGEFNCSLVIGFDTGFDIGFDVEFDGVRHWVRRRVRHIFLLIAAFGR